MLGARLTIKLITPEIKTKVDNEIETSFNFEEESINFGYDFNDGNDCGFLRHLREVHKCDFTDSFSEALWTILHEIGHYETDYTVEDEEDMSVRMACALIPYEIASTNVEIQDAYFNLEAEWLATEWAINWIKSHPIKARILNVLAQL